MNKYQCTNELMVKKVNYIINNKNYCHVIYNLRPSRENIQKKLSCHKSKAALKMTERFHKSIIVGRHMPPQLLSALFCATRRVTLKDLADGVHSLAGHPAGRAT